MYSPLPAYWLPLEWEIWRRQMQLRSLAGQLWRKHYNYGSCYWAGCIYYIERSDTKNCKGNGKSSACYGGDLSSGRHHCHCGTRNDASKCVWSNFFRRVQFTKCNRGISGSIMLVALRSGVSRGIFTNEAGLGSSVMAHTEADCKEPAEQGMWGFFRSLPIPLSCVPSQLFVFYAVEL